MEDNNNYSTILSDHKHDSTVKYDCSYINDKSEFSIQYSTITLSKCNNMPKA